jgi:peptidoglycan/LPS O-acetylase OafA/YrhL
MTTSPTPSHDVRRDIQGLRALAVVAVVLCHAIGWPTGGFAGVDVFFVISGFLITGLLLREVDRTGRISLRGFAARRVRRILPASLVVLVAVAFLAFNRPRAEQTLGDAIAAALLVSNWRFAADGTDYFHATDAVSPLQHFWSLSVEEQFYLVWPLLIVALLLIPLARRGATSVRIVVGLAAVAIGVTSYAWAMVDTPTEPTVAYFATTTRLWELAAGAVLAALSPLLGRIPAALRILLGWAGLAGILWSFVVIEADSPFPAPWATLPVAATALVIASGVGGDPRARHLFPLSNPLSVVVGDMSYSIYLWHSPVIVFAAVLLPAGAPATGIVLGTIAILSLASYLIVEQPLHRSPWLRPVPRREAVSAEDRSRPSRSPAAGPDASAGAVAAPAPARAFNSRPPGWTPGVRYFPGAPPRSGVGPQGASDARELTSGPAAVVSAAVDPHGIEPGAESVAAERPSVEPNAVEVSSATPATPASRELSPTERRALRRADWATWRARFTGQMALSAVALAIGAGVLVLTLQSTVGGLPVLGPLVPAAPTTEAQTDPLPALQEELAAAASASAWPALNPSLDDVIVRSSGDNPAHDCFAPDIALDAGRCTWGSADAPNHMYLVGDSTAMAYAPAFKKIAEDSGGSWRITTVGLYGCRFTDVLVQNDGAGVMAACPQRKADVRAAIAADPAQLVVVSNAYTLGRTTDGADLSASALITATQAETATYGMPGRIALLAPPPLGADLGQCYSPLSSPANCLSGVDSTWKDMELAAEAAAAASGDHAVSALPFSCWQDVCPAFAGTLPTKYDQTHLTVAYAEHIAPALRWSLASVGLM